MIAPRRVYPAVAKLAREFAPKQESPDLPPGWTPLVRQAGAGVETKGIEEQPKPSKE